MKRFSQVAMCSLLLAIGCSQSPPPEPKDMRAEDEATIRKLDEAWSQAASSKQLDAVVSYYSDDASLLPPGEPTITDKEAIRKAWEGLLTAPNSSLHWDATKVEVARSGDLAYSQGTYEMMFDDAKGKPLVDRGKYLEVWKKQVDGSWKAVSDAFSSDTPAPVPVAK
jgi:uncharacterized protein (TIGR02246 family)